MRATNPWVGPRPGQGIGGRSLGWILAVILTWLGNGWSGRAMGAVDTLVFGSTTQEVRVSEPSARVLFTFAFTNVASGPVVIQSVRTSCGCTVAEVPMLPWTIESGGAGEFSVALDARGKRGTVNKSVFLNTSMGVKPLIIRAFLPSSAELNAMDDRQRNMQIALADRTAIFRGDCAGCHATPASGKTGPALYAAVCGVCHDSPNRASMVPDLRRLEHGTDVDHWLRWIAFGKHGSLMAGFAKTEGGPLSEVQIDSLAEYLDRTISRRGATAAGWHGGEGASMPGPWTARRSGPVTVHETPLAVQGAGFPGTP